MIAYKLGDSARLGNQMFCIATVYGYAQTHNETPQFDINNPYTKIFNLPFGGKEPQYRYKEKEGIYEPIPHHHDLEIEGYFQDERYFKHAREKILKVFGFNQQTYDLISIHVRRGDYLNHPEKFTISPLEYYEEAMLALGGDEQDFMIFSDDINWCRQQFGRAANIAYFEGSALDSMDLMSQCKYNIISASSFGWWAAWLNQNPQKIVIAPKQWWGPEWMWKNDPCPKNWIRI